MPIGVPKIAYRLPGDADSEWVDLYTGLYRERVLFLGSALDDELANQLIALCLYLNAEDSSKRLYLYINSPGGSMTCGISLYDAMNHVSTTVTTICMGLAASMASLILASGEKEMRLSLNHARIMLHQPQGGTEGQARQVTVEAEEVIRLRKQVGSIYAQHTGQTLATIACDMDRDSFLSAQEAKAYGLIDHVANNKNRSV